MSSIIESIKKFISSNENLKDDIKLINKIIEKFKNNEPILKEEFEKFKNFKNQIEYYKNNIKKDTIDYNKLVEIEKEYNENENVITEHYENNSDLVEDLIIVNFSDTASIFNLLLKYLILFCVFIYIIVLLISFINVVNLIILCIKSVINTFYNTVLINNDSIAFKIKGITKTTKTDFSYDICNVLNEQLTALSIFNMTIYIFYIILAYLFIYMLMYFYYNYIMIYTHKFVGTIKDIDPDAYMMQIKALLFALSIVHIFIYKILLKKCSINSYKNIDNDEKNFENIIFNNSYFNSSTPNETDNKFYNLLIDTTKYDEVNLFFENKLNELNEENNEIGKYLIIYNIYNFFSNYLIMNDLNQYKLGVYLRLISKKNDDKSDDITFLSLLDSNNKRLIKLSHEDLKFYKNIPKDKIELFKEINNDVIAIISKINKSIISYNGPFFPFITMIIYIILIFIYNVISVYIIFEVIHATKSNKIFPDLIYTMTDYYKKIINKLLE